MITIGQGIALTLVAMAGVTMRDKGVISTPLPELIDRGRGAVVLPR